MGFFLQKLFSALLLPPGIIVPAALAAWLLWRRGGSFAAKCIAFWTAAFLLLLSLGPLSDPLVASLEDAYPSLGRPEDLEAAEFADYEAVVVLGAALVTGSPEEGGATAIADDFYPRLLYAARLASRLYKPLAIAGGSATAGPDPQPEAATRLLRDLGYADLDVFAESASLTTRGNATELARLFPWRKVILVTSAFHMPRAMLEFRGVGFDPLAAPAGYKVMRGGANFQRFLPQARTFDRACDALKEYLGIAIAWLF